MNNINNGFLVVELFVSNIVIALMVYSYFDSDYTFLTLPLLIIFDGIIFYGINKGNIVAKIIWIIYSMIAFTLLFVVLGSACSMQ